MMKGLNAELDHDPEIVIYHIEGRRSFRVAWLCEELEIPYRLIFTPGDIIASMAGIREAYPDMPLAPVVKINGSPLVESGAILDVISARYGDGKLVPPADSDDYLSHAQWMHFTEGTALARMSMEFFSAQTKGLAADEIPAGYRRGDPQPMSMVGSIAVFEYAERHLSRHRYFGGSQFRAADIMVHFMIALAPVMVAIDPSACENISRWRSDVEARAAYKRAVDKCLPSGVNEFGLPADQPLFVQPVAADRMRTVLLN
jgi:glutathione S-transferase